MKLHIILQLMRDYLLRRGGLRTITAFLLRLLGKRILLSVIIDITYKCQCNCIHCANKQYNKIDDVMETSKIFDLIDSAIPLGLTRITLFGGEPTIRSDLPRIIRYARKRGLFTSLNTNGILLEEKVAEYAEAGINRINVSIDFAVPEEHDRQRGLSGCFKKAISGIKKSLSLGVDTRITTVVYKNRMHELVDVIELGKELGVSCVNVLYPVPIGGLGMSEILSKDEHDQVRKIMDQSFSYNPREDGPFIGCGAGATKINISPNGDVKPCSFIPIKFGNVYDEPLNQIWKRMGKHWAFSKSVPFCWMRDHEFRKMELNLSN